jgi:hypothetical protein
MLLKVILVVVMPSAAATTTTLGLLGMQSNTSISDTSSK